MSYPSSPPPCTLKVRKTTVRLGTALSHNPTMAVTPGIPPLGHLCEGEGGPRLDKAVPTRGNLKEPSGKRRSDGHPCLHKAVLAQWGGGARDLLRREK